MRPRTVNRLRSLPRARARILCVALALPLLLAGCPSSAGKAQVIPNPFVQGTYLYVGSSGAFPLRGLITFEQDVDTVRVLSTTYFNALDRSLKGEATLAGDTLTIRLVPVNGDTDFHADCTFVFSADRNTFIVQFADTNGDNGPLGSYRGTRQ